MKTLRFFPLKPRDFHPESSLDVDVICNATRRRVEWNVAAKEGWVSSNVGKAFTYLSADAAKALDAVAYSAAFAK